MPKSKTKPIYRETKFGILSVTEIEALITDGVANVNTFLLRECENLPIGAKTAKELHEKIAGHVFAEAKGFIDRAKISPRQELQLKRQAVIRMTRHSTEIEGNRLDMKQVEALYANKKIDAPDRDVYEVKKLFKRAEIY